MGSPVKFLVDSLGISLLGSDWMGCERKDSRGLLQADLQHQFDLLEHGWLACWERNFEYHLENGSLGNCLLLDLDEERCYWLDEC